MKRFIPLSIGLLLIFSCNNTNKKEIDEIDELLEIINKTENKLLALDTAKIFESKRQIVLDFKNYTQFTDTIKKEEALRIDDIFGTKKKFIRIHKYYTSILENLNYSKLQLNALKTDLNNELLSKEVFLDYLNSEKNALDELLTKFNKSTTNFEEAIAKYKIDRTEVLQLIENRRKRFLGNE